MTYAAITLAILIVDPWDWRAAFAPGTWSNWFLGVVGILGTIAALCTLKAIYKQARLMMWQGRIFLRQTRATELAAKAGNDSAGAALLNAKAIINSERPWIVVTIERSAYRVKNALFVVTNKGRTPAEFISGDFAWTFARRPEDLPSPPIYDAPFIAPDDTLLVQNDPFPIRHAIADPPIGVCPEAIISEHAQKNPGAVYDILFFYGRIVYKDVLNPDKSQVHETRWCFSFHPEGMRFIRGLPTEYNGYT